MAARSLSGFGRRRALHHAQPWPPDSPGAANAWLLLVTNNPPHWRDPFVVWRDLPPTLGTPHEGFYYPDPLGFWTEVRRWITVLVSTAEPGISTSDALAVAALVHLDGQTHRLGWALRTLRPAIVLFLDEACWEAAALTTQTVAFAIPDPHRRGVVYEGLWGRSDGRTVGKSPQHPAAHQLYRRDDMDAFLRGAPSSMGD